MASLPRPAPSLTALFCACLVRASPGTASPDTRPVRLTSPPCAFNVSGALPATSILIAAFRSRSIDRPQSLQLNVRSDRGSLAFTTPQFEHVLLDGNHLSTTRNTAPVRAVLYSSWRRTPRGKHPTGYEQGCGFSPYPQRSSPQHTRCCRSW